MIQLQSDDLPEIGEPLTQTLKGLPVMQFSGGMAPVAVINPFAHFREVGFLPTAYSMDYPDYLGYLLRAEQGMTIYDLNRLTGFTLIESGIKAMPNTCWLDVSAIEIYSLTQISTIEPVLKLLSKAPIPDANLNYTITIPVGVTVTKVESEGLTFNLVDDVEDPQTGEFIQSGTRLRLYGDSVFRLITGAEVIISAISSIEPDIIGRIATFDLSGQGLTYIDAVDWMGISFIPCRNLANPKVGDYFWELPYLHLVFNSAIAPGLATKTEASRTYQSAISSIEYQGEI